MQTVTPGTNCWTQAQDAILGALPTLTAFRTIVEAATEAEARYHVFIDYWQRAWDGEAITKAQAEQLLGGAVVKPPEDAPYVYDIVNGRARAAGVLEIKLIRLVREQDAELWDENDRLARNWIGDLVAELSLWAQNNMGRNWMGQIRVERGPNHRPKKMRDSAGHVYEAMLSFPWGDPSLRGGLSG